MAVTSEAKTQWAGSLVEGSGTTSLVSSGAASFDVTWAARSEGQTRIPTLKNSSVPHTLRATRWRSLTH